MKSLKILQLVLIIYLSQFVLIFAQRHTFFVLKHDQLHRITATHDQFFDQPLGTSQIEKWSIIQSTVQISEKEVFLQSTVGTYIMDLRDGSYINVSKDSINEYVAPYYINGQYSVISFGSEVRMSDISTGDIRDYSYKHWNWKGNWSDAVDVTYQSDNQNLYVLTNSNLYEVSTSYDSNYRKNDPYVRKTFNGAKCLMQYNNNLYVIDSSGIYEVNQSKNVKNIAGGQWNNLQKGKCINMGQYAYAISNDSIFYIDLQTGNYNAINTNNQSLSKVVGIFKGSDYLSNSAPPLSGGYWKLIFKVINPIATYTETFTTAVGIYSKKEESVELSTEVSIRKSIEASASAGGFDGSVSAEFGVTFQNNLAQSTSQGIERSQTQVTEHTFTAGQTVARWQYILKGKGIYEDYEIGTSVYQDTNGEMPLNE